MERKMHMPTGILTNGLPTAPDDLEFGPEKPNPPEQTEDQPFGYRFREVPEALVTLENLTYDPEAQVSRLNGEIFAGPGVTIQVYKKIVLTRIGIVYDDDEVSDTRTGVGY
jgi:hypothetical protein